MLKHHAHFAADLVDVLEVVGQFGAVDDDLACWCSSSRLMQRIIVDLPEPDGPQMTMRSPFSTRQVDVLQHVELAVPLVHAAHLDHQLIGACVVFG